MKICVNCGTELEDRDGYCSTCGAAQRSDREQRPEQTGYQAGQPDRKDAGKKQPAPGKVSKLLESDDHTAAYQPADIEGNTLFCVLSYLGILCLIPLLAGKDSPYVRFHTNQGLVLFLTTIILNMARALLTGLWIFGKVDRYFVTPVFTALNVAVFALTIIGIANAVRGKAADLPLIGKVRLI